MRLIAAHQLQKFGQGVQPMSMQFPGTMSVFATEGFSVPPPPEGPLPDPMVLAVISAVLAVTATAILGWVIRSFVKERSTLGIFIVSAALIGATVEPEWDFLLGVQFFPASGTPALYSPYGLNVFLWFFGAWVVWVCLIGIPVIYADRRGRRSSDLWWILVAGILFDATAQALVSRLHVSTYYGPQPFKILGGAPFHVPVVLATAFATSGLLLGRLHDRLPGYRKLAALPVSGLATTAVVAWANLPVFLGRGTGLSSTALNLLGLVSIALALWTFALVLAACGLEQQDGPPLPAD
ncbi:hypothetical protein [Kitasatospora purpeofusca]|uniref:hypothetical protein n=1 Tax=Kitasatospora purpeofusca TaxID=67352 RepID=UPI0036961DDC